MQFESRTASATWPTNGHALLKDRCYIAKIASMPNGVRPGERRGGRKKGTPNKATRERVLLAKRILEEQKGRPGRKLAREVLDDFMHLFLGMAAQHQPLPIGMAAGPGQQPNEPKFLEFAKLAIDTAAQLAPYQSPKLKAVLVSRESQPDGHAVGPGSGHQHGAMVPMSAQEAYRRLRDSDIIDISPARQLR